MDLIARIDDLQARVTAREPLLQTLLPEAGRFERLRREARALCDRFPDPTARPPLFGLLVGVKDIFHVDGCETRAGSRLPPAVLQGGEADVVSRLKHAGALILGKTITTEFAHSAPGPTRNPRNPEHTPGGSSSGSAAAVAAGFCDVALGSQTIGSIIRPAAFCGVVGLKPTCGRVSARGVIPFAPSLDHVGCLALDVATVRLVAPVLYDSWDASTSASQKPVLGVPAGRYLTQAAPQTLEWFGRVCESLRATGYDVRRVPVMADYAAVDARHRRIVAAEAARVHAAWFAACEEFYGAAMTDVIRRGRSISDTELQAALAGQAAFRTELSQRMQDEGIDAWVCPATVGPAPRGLESTGDPGMNLPWTHAGLPAVTVPAGDVSELPMGLQIVGRWGADEWLLARAEALQRAIAEER